MLRRPDKAFTPHPATVPIEPVITHFTVIDKTLLSGQNHHSLSARHAAAQGHSLTDIARDSHFYFTPLFHRIIH